MGVNARKGDPQNDQTAASVNAFLDELIDSMRELRRAALSQGAHDEPALMAITAITVSEAGYSIIQLSSTIAAALLRLTRDEIQPLDADVEEGYRLLAESLKEEEGDHGGFDGDRRSHS